MTGVQTCALPICVSGILVDKFDIDAIIKALKLDRSTVSAEASKWSWDSCTVVFKNNLVLK